MEPVDPTDADVVLTVTVVHERDSTFDYGYFHREHLART